MAWMLSFWMAVALPLIWMGKMAAQEGKSLSPSGYHLCAHNETRTVSSLAIHKVPYTVTKPCGGWLLWKTCTVTLYRSIHQTEYRTIKEQVTRCCDGYVQVGRYCALSVNRSVEFTTKPGSCPNADGWCPRSEDFAASYSENGGYRFNATVTVKMDYKQLISDDKGLMNHSRLLHAMVTGALQSDLSVYYLASWPVHPYRTASSLLIYSNFTLLLNNVKSKLYVLLKHIQEVSSVTVEDIDECAHPALRQCSSQAQCNNTVGSYQCTCHGGYVDVDPSNPGSQCAEWGSEVINISETSETMKEVRGLQPGILYSASVTPQADGSQGDALHISVKTDAQSLDVSARLTNIQFTVDLWNTGSQAYKNLTASIIEEIHRSLSLEMRAMVDAGHVRVEVRNFSPGSVVVNFTIIAIPSESQDITNTSTALLHSLMNSSKYTVDENNTSINDFDECAPGENDCSQWGSCTNTWASYVCSCLDGFMDTNPQRPGRACQAPVTTNALMTGAISVQCRVAAITVILDREFLQKSKIQESSLYLGLQECGVNGGNATHAQLTVAWNECVTTLVHNETYYMASVTLFNDMDPYISPNGTLEAPRVRLQIPVMCTYMRRMLMSADFSSMGYDMMKDVIVGSGLFHVTVQLLNGTTPLPHNYSLSPEEAVVVEVSMNTSAEQIKVVIDSCWATPNPNPVDTSRYIFLDNRCALNKYTSVLINGNSSTSRVSVKIFSFVSVSMIYFHCHVQICLQIGSDTCVSDCGQRTSRSSKSIGSALGSSGPLRKSAEESLEEKVNMLELVGLSCLGVGLVLFLIVGFICLFYCQRNRIGHYNFSVKPKQENFTYLEFNT
ncbi:LOW QUALITY PROTEIN: uromodulin-like 1 [Lampetra planeri]